MEFKGFSIVFVSVVAFAFCPWCGCLVLFVMGCVGFGLERGREEKIDLRETRKRRGEKREEESREEKRREGKGREEKRREEKRREEKRKE